MCTVSYTPSAKSLSIIFSIKFLEMVSFSISFPPEMFLIIYHIIKFGNLKVFMRKPSEKLKSIGGLRISDKMTRGEEGGFL